MNPDAGYDIIVYYKTESLFLFEYLVWFEYLLKLS